MDFILDDIHSLFDDSKEGLDRITKIIQSLRDFSRVDQVSNFANMISMVESKHPGCGKE